MALNLRVTEKPLEALEGDLRAFYYVLYLNYGQAIKSRYKANRRQIGGK